MVQIKHQWDEALSSQQKIAIESTTPNIGLISGKVNLKTWPIIGTNRARPKSPTPDMTSFQRARSCFLKQTSQPDKACIVMQCARSLTPDTTPNIESSEDLAEPWLMALCYGGSLVTVRQWGDLRQSIYTIQHSHRYVYPSSCSYF